MTPPDNGKPPGAVKVDIPPGPVPTQVMVDQATTPAGPVVMLRFFTPTGMGVYFLPLDAAKQIAQIIADRATPLTLP